MHKLKVIALSSTLAFGLMVNCVFSFEIEADSKITQIIVYPDSALLTRSVSLKLDTGEHTAVFSDIIPDMDENSLRVSAQGPAEVKLLGAQLRKEFLEEVPSERIKQLKDEIQALEDEKRRLEDNKIILSEEKKFLDSIRFYADVQTPKDLATKMPQVAELDNMLKFLGTKLKDNFSSFIDYEFKIRDINSKADALKRQLAEVSGPSRKLKRSIIVELEALQAGNLDLEVSYLVKGASWQPIYDARADFEKSQVELISYGIIKQITGEDWQNVEISLSTARPSIGGSMPYISPWILRPYHPQRILESRMDAAEMKSRGDASQFEAFKKKGDLSSAPSSVEYAQREEKGIAVVYKLAKKATVKSDGSEHKLPVSSQALNAKFEYSSFPRAGLYAYLGSRVTNAPGLQLLSGRVNIFLEGDFVGASSIDNIAPNEEFDLYLGIDENVKVKREQLEKKVDETLIAGIPATTRRTIFKYKITLENYKSKKIKVKLFEAMPVPEDDRIKVKINQVTHEPTLKDWKDRKGIWLWEFELEPKQKRELIYSYTIEHPREMQVEGL
ncbi:MAG: hypothetical protein A3J51_01810 [Omnitrophica WOR_2 bacterium RIFCSPHIGHO2_02_FULL_45_21]|nr:MAG: hypothetical protein A3J51_01810 [Omnitrophica WOR_2 bacterium RIFCSPHIGHO2_02_FULL_45_21]